MAFAVFVAIGLYAASLTLQRHNVNPATHRAFVAVLIVLATVVAARIAGSLVMRHSQRAAHTIGSISLFTSVRETLVAIVGGLVVLQYLGISVALALQDTLANFFSGIQITASSYPIKNWRGRSLPRRRARNGSRRFPRISR